MASNRLFTVYFLISLVSKGFAEPEPLIGGHPVGKIEKIGDNLVVKSDNKHPYVVHLSFSETEASEGMKDKQCGGVLIGARTVLTAAHCIKNMKSEPEIEVSAGRIHLWLQKSQIITVEKYRVHENYVKTCGKRESPFQFCQNDIALLWLEKRFIFSSSIQTATLASERSLDRKHGIVFGWGQTENKKPSPMLRKAEHKIIPHSSCKKYFPNIIFDETKLCLISSTLSSTVCNGDSGGPFVSNDVVLGISSFGRTACNPQNPSVYTNVTKYENWIKSTVKAWSLQEFKQLKFEGEKNNRRT